MSFSDAVNILCEAIDRAETERADSRHADRARTDDLEEGATTLATDAGGASAAFVERDDLICNFCGKTARESSVLVSGPNVYICDLCIGVCCDIVEEKRRESGEPPADVADLERLGAIDIAIRSHPNYRAMLDNLTATQQRCNELLHEKRVLAHALGAAVDEVAIAHDGNYGRRDEIRDALIAQAVRELGR